MSFSDTGVSNSGRVGGNGIGVWLCTGVKTDCLGGGGECGLVYCSPCHWLYSSVGNDS